MDEVKRAEVDHAVGIVADGIRRLNGLGVDNPEVQDYIYERIIQMDSPVWWDEADERAMENE